MRAVAGESRAVVYCVIPRGLARSLHEPLRRHFAADAVDVVVEQRGTDRRSAAERRRDAAELEAERRRVRAQAGRRVADRRAPSVAVDAPKGLPRVAVRHVDRLVFIERLEPATQELEDVDTARLVIRFQAGERDVFAALYLRYFDHVYNYLRLLLNNSHDAEDGTQQVFTQVLNALPRYERRSQPFRVWLFVVVRNVAFDRLRQQNRVDIVTPEDLNRSRDRHIPDDSEVEGTLGWISDRELLMFIERLPLAQRQVLMLRYMMDLSTADIARVLERSTEDVRILQHRALRFLRDRLSAVGRGPSGGKSMRMRRGVPKSSVLRSRRFALLR
jgi:RNA polymerase sigma-70 factor (ECF subfamily)